jgi:hypothetical protein
MERTVGATVITAVALSLHPEAVLATRRAV